jgi:SH3-like domain-containing protein
MFSIAKFFERIQGVQAKEVFVRVEIQKVIKLITSIEVPLESISFKSSVVEIKNVPQAFKSVLYIKKGALLKAINEVQQIRVVTDIR